jgi:hypothetical protein
VGPLSVLYLHLIPPDKKSLKKKGLKKGLKGPPLIHCGYIAEEEFFFKYTCHHGLLQECPGENEGDTVLLKLDIMYAAIEAILTELKISSIPIHLPVVVTNDGGTHIIALYSTTITPENYSWHTF